MDKYFLGVFFNKNELLMKKLSLILLTSLTVASNSYPLRAMDPAPYMLTADDFYVNQAKKDLDVELVNCEGPEDLCESLKKLLQTYSPDALSLPLRIYFDNNPKLVCMQGKYGNTALHLAADEHNSYSMAKLLLEAAGDKACQLVCMKGFIYATALHLAANNNNYPLAKLFLDIAGDKACQLVFMRTERWPTALHFAANNNNVALAKLLLEAAGDKACQLVCMMLINGETAMHFAINNNNETMIQLLKQYSNNHQGI
jgi:ankyrin repeat protein